MGFRYDSEVDVFRILFSHTAVVEESEEVGDGVVVDYDTAGKVVGVEILDASDRVDLINSLSALIAAGDGRRAATK